MQTCGRTCDTCKSGHSFARPARSPQRPDNTLREHSAPRQRHSARACCAVLRGARPRCGGCLSRLQCGPARHLAGEGPVVAAPARWRAGARVRWGAHTASSQVSSRCTHCWTRARRERRSRWGQGSWLWVSCSGKVRASASESRKTCERLACVHILHTRVCARLAVSGVSALWCSQPLLARRR